MQLKINHKIKSQCHHRLKHAMYHHYMTIKQMLLHSNYPTTTKIPTQPPQSCDIAPLHCSKCNTTTKTSIPKQYCDHNPVTATEMPPLQCPHNNIASVNDITTILPQQCCPPQYYYKPTSAMKLQSTPKHHCNAASTMPLQCHPCNASIMAL
jgi:hypothetical protein